jgi:SMC interacting uncharacterized protein involved in chromosome segregation
MSVNGSFPHLMEQLDRRLGRIEQAIDRLDVNLDERHEKISERINALEKTKAEVAGGWKVASVIGGIAGAVGGITAKWLGG